MGPKRVTPSLKSARRSIVQAPGASRRHSMITRSKTPRASGPDAISAPLSSISAANATGVDCTFTLDIHPISSASATAMDSTSSVNIDSIVLPPSGSTTSPSLIAIPVLPNVLSDDDCDDNFHGEVETYLDYTSDLLKAQAEEVKLLRREVASARKEKDALKAQHEADMTARKEEYQCPICFELLWDPYVLPCGHSFCARCLSQQRMHDFRTKSRNYGTLLITCCPLCRAEVCQKPVLSCTIQQGVQLVANEAGIVAPPPHILRWPW